MHPIWAAHPRTHLSSEYLPGFRLPLSALATAVGNNLRLKVAPNMADQWVLMKRDRSLKLETLYSHDSSWQSKRVIWAYSLQKLCVGFLPGLITSQACVSNHEWFNLGGGVLNFLFWYACVAQRVKKKTSAKFGVFKNWFFVQFEAFETETWPNVRHKNWTFLQFWAFEMQIFQKFVISSKCRILRN